MPLLWDLLDFVEKETDRKFIVADKLDAPHWQQFWYMRRISEYRTTKFFSNRPFPCIGKPVRQAKFLPKTERFLRLDLELPEHSEIPTAEDRQVVEQWAKDKAIGVLQTPHGTHVYFLSSTDFKWADAKAIVAGLMQTYTGKMIACEASWCQSDWSRTNRAGNCSLSQFSPKNKQQDIYLYCGTISSSKNSGAKSYKSSTYTQKSRKGGSRQENNDEFKQVWHRLRGGESMDSVCAELKCHTRAEIEKAMSDPRYAIKANFKANGGQGRGFLEGEVEWLGNGSDSRCIQRSGKLWAHVAHSLRDLQDLTNEKAIQTINDFPQFQEVKKHLVGQVGDKWESWVCEHLDKQREHYEGRVGNLWVSEVVLDHTLHFISQAKSITCKELHEYLKVTLPAPKTERAFHGSSQRHTKRILSLLTEAGILLRYDAGRSTSYTAQPLTKLLLEKLSCCNTKCAVGSVGDVQRTVAAREEKEEALEVGANNPLQVRRGSHSEDEQDKTTHSNDSLHGADVGLHPYPAKTADGLAASVEQKGNGVGANRLTSGKKLYELFP